jgi:hypothetical protein
MGNYPWGPHGPQSGPNEVTPNPTPSYVPPPPAPTYYPPASAPASSYGGGTTSNSGSGYSTAIPSGPSLKHYWLALVLTMFFGPLGLFYASKKGALIVLFLLFAVPIGLSMAGMLPWGSPDHPFAILDHNSVMDVMWSRSVALSMIWSVVAVRRKNAKIKASS